MTAQHSMSPLPKQVTKPNALLSFTSALEEVLKGKKIHKLEWIDKKYYGVLKDGTLQLHKPDDKFYSWIISDGDMSGTDWTIL